jgi:competence protein ComEC
MRRGAHHAPLVPAVILLLGYGAGLATGLARFPAPALGVLAPALAAWLLARREAWTLALAAAALGQAAAWSAWRAEPARCAALLPAGRVELRLLPVDPPAPSGGPVAALLPGRKCTGQVLVRWPAGARAEVGRGLVVQGRWVSRRDGAFGRPGGTLVADSLRADPGLRAPAWLRWRARLLARTAALYGTRAPLVDALLFDRRGGIDRDTRDRFAASGLVHLLSISGFHVGLIVAWVLMVLRGARVRRERAWVLATAAGLAYVAWLGWPAPATRAAALAVVLCLARLRQRVVRWEALLAVTALAVLLADPWAIADLGAWLSVTSLAGATYAGRWSDRRFGTGALARTLSGSLGATLATAPLTAGQLGTVALAGVALNFIGIPLAAVAVPAVLASVLVAPLLPPLGAALAAGGGALLYALDRLAALGALLPWGHLTVEEGWAGAWPWGVVVVGAWWAIRDVATRAVAATRLAAFAGALLWAGLARGVWDARAAHRVPGLTLHFLDVGQGDALALETPHGAWILVDAGPAGPEGDAGRRVVAPFLAAHRVRRLAAAIVSHPHADHYGGMAAVLRRVPAERLLDPGRAVDDPRYAALLADALAEGAAWAPLRRGAVLEVDGVRLEALHPDTLWAGWGLDLNEDSDVLRVRYGRFDALLAGDAGLPAESLLAGRVGDVELLKVGHHGSGGASGAAWLAELRPEAAVISVGRGNRYGHPHPAALARLAAAGAEVWRTDRDGTVTAWTDGTAVEVRAGSRTRRFLAH